MGLDLYIQTYTSLLKYIIDLIFTFLNVELGLFVFLMEILEQVDDNA